MSMYEHVQSALFQETPYSLQHHIINLVLFVVIVMVVKTFAVYGLDHHRRART